MQSIGETIKWLERKGQSAGLERFVVRPKLDSGNEMQPNREAPGNQKTSETMTER